MPPLRFPSSYPGERATKCGRSEGGYSASLSDALTRTATTVPAGATPQRDLAATMQSHCHPSSLGILVRTEASLRLRFEPRSPTWGSEGRGFEPRRQPPESFGVCRCRCRSVNVLPWSCSSSASSAFARVLVQCPAYRRSPAPVALMNVRSTARLWKWLPHRTVAYWPSL